MQVSGLRYTIDTRIPSSVKLDEKGFFLSVDGERRVKDVQVQGKDVYKRQETKTVGELLALAKENGVEFTAEEAETYFEQLHPKTGELSDEELDLSLIHILPRSQAATLTRWWMFGQTRNLPRSQTTSTQPC